MASALRVLSLLASLALCLCHHHRVAPPPNVYGAGCGTCEEDLCPGSSEQCRSRLLIRDPCGCCPSGVCGLDEGDKCYGVESSIGISDTGLRRYGACGEYMDCVMRTDIKSSDRPEYLCKCQQKETVCGSDNNTYGSLCEMRSAKADLVHYGPCLTRPTIITKPEASYTYEGSAFALDCEAKGYPVPTINWEFQSNSGFMGTLPGDDTTVVVHSRGGPERYTITSWLQIESLRMNDTGTFICVARNSQGEDRAMANIHVTIYSH